MSQYEDPDRLRPDRDITVDDVRELVSAATPHFALQIRARIRRLIANLPADHPARVEGEREIGRLEALAFHGEVRGTPPQPGMRTLASVDDAAVA